MVSRHPISITISFILLRIVLSGVSLAQQGSSEEESVYALMTRGYELLRHDPEAAINLFEQVVALDPSNVNARKQLGSTYISVGRLEEALTQFSVADYLSPSDTTKLQIAYLLNSLGLDRESYTQFEKLESSSNPDIGLTSHAATAVLEPTLSRDRAAWWGKLSAAPYYDTRFENAVFWGSFYGGRYLTRTNLLSLFGMVGVTRDTRTAGGAVPVIFSDNYMLAAVGFRLQPTAGLTADAQGGVSVDLDTHPGRDRIREDLRMVLSYGAGTYASVSVPRTLKVSWKPWADAYTSAGYYSRYENIIGYAMVRGGVRLLEAGYSEMDLYVRGNLAWDTERIFYNNVAEGGLGLRFVPHHSWGVAVLAEFHRGFYWDRGLPTGALERWYSSGRFFLVLERALDF